MKTINLYFDFEFTSLSPDAQIISLGIVSDEIIDHKFLIHPNEFERLNIKNKEDYELVDSTVGLGYMKRPILKSKSFYSEFSDFDLNRCDDWVKENVVSKLKYYGTPEQDKMFLDSSVDEGTYWGSQNTTEIKTALRKWLSQFSDYQIQFVCDCGTFDWYWLLKLLAKWDKKYTCLDCGKEYTKEESKKIERTCSCNKGFKHGFYFGEIHKYKTGLPKLPANISPVPFDLNDLIAIKKGITPKEAFELNREELFNEHAGFLPFDHIKHNAIFDARVIKEIYNKLK